MAKTRLEKPSAASWTNGVTHSVNSQFSSYDRSVGERSKDSESETNAEVNMKKDTKIRIIKKDDMVDIPKGPKLLWREV
jgi:hypothetical protein